MKRTWFLGAALSVALATAATTADAQIIDPGRDRPRGFVGQPKAWVSLFAGFAQHQGLCEPESESCWSFGDALQWRAALDFPIGNGAQIGVVGTHAKMPLIYSGGLLSGCSGCDADANVSSLLGQLRIGGGSGIHQVIDVTAGMTLYSNFRRTDGTRLDPERTVSNWTFAIAPGIALPLSPRAQVILAQEWGIVVGKRVSGRSTNSAQTQTLRLGFRYGLGT